MSIGQRIRERRKALGMSQQQLADALKINRVSVTQWEANTTAPELQRIPDVAAVLGASPAWVAFGDGTGPSALDRDLLRDVLAGLLPQVLPRVDINYDALAEVAVELYEQFREEEEAARATGRPSSEVTPLAFRLAAKLYKAK